MESALEAVELGSVNVTEASKVSGKYSKASGGRKPELTEEEEKILMD